MEALTTKAREVLEKIMDSGADSWIEVVFALNDGECLAAHGIDDQDAVEEAWRYALEQDIMDTPLEI